MTTPTFARTAPLALTAVSCALLLAGCAATATTTGTTTPQASVSRTATRQAPGAWGIIAEIEGKTLQVQGTSSQTAVTYTSSTTFTRQVSGDADDLTVGSCVRVTSGPGTSAESASPSTSVTATAIAVTRAVDGQCSGFGDAGSGAGGRPSGASDQGGARPSDAPSGAPSGAPAGRGRMVAGEVAAVGDQTITVSATQPGSDQATTVTVKIADTTAVTTTTKASAAALKVGLCANARGSADATGAVTATSIALSAAVDGSCGMGR